MRDIDALFCLTYTLKEESLHRKCATIVLANDAAYSITYATLFVAPVLLHENRKISVEYISISIIFAGKK